jgi:hypothetical protein
MGPFDFDAAGGILLLENKMTGKWKLQVVKETGQVGFRLIGKGRLILLLYTAGSSARLLAA